MGLKALALSKCMGESFRFIAKLFVGGFSLFHGSGSGFILFSMHGFQSFCSVPMHECQLLLHSQALCDGFALFQGRGVDLRV
jgi:hypothetical protein